MHRVSNCPALYSPLKDGFYSETQKTDLRGDEEGIVHNSRQYTTTIRSKMHDSAYYGIPVVVDGVCYDSVADYETVTRHKNEEETRCQKLTADLKLLIKQMVLDEKVEKLAQRIEETVCDTYTN